MRNILKMKEFSRLMSYMKPRMLPYAVGMTGQSILVGTFNILLAFVLKYMVEAPIKGQMSLLLKSIAIIGIAIFVVVLTYPVLYYIYKRSVKKTMAHIRLKSYRHMQKLPIGFFSETHSGDLLSRVSNDTQIMEMAYADQLQTVIATSLLGLGSAVIMVIIEWRVSLLMLVMCFGIMLLNMRFAENIRKISDGVQQKVGELMSSLGDFLSGFAVMKMFGIEEIISRRYKEKNSELTALTGKRVATAAFLDASNYLLAMASFAGMLCIGAFMTVGQKENFGGIAALVQLQMNVNQAFTSIGTFVAQLQVSLAGAGRVFELMEQPVEAPQAFRDKNSDETLAVQLKNVYFDYNEGSKTLNNIEFKVSEGRKAALVGQSGSGKSTIAKILLGYYPVSKGEVFIHGKAIGSYTLRELRNKIAYVSQDTYLMNGTIKENILFGNLQASEEEIIEAAIAARAHDFIIALPEGYDTQIGERGAKLSGGERQRICIARAVLKNAPILILDEATSALDTENEQKVQQAIEDISRNRTVITIAHRISTVKDADMIYVLKDGGVAETGRHQELIEKEGVYKSIFKTQLENVEECVAS